MAPCRFWLGCKAIKKGNLEAKDCNLKRWKTSMVIVTCNEPLLIGNSLGNQVANSEDLWRELRGQFDTGCKQNATTVNSITNRLFCTQKLIKSDKTKKFY